MNSDVMQPPQLTNGRLLMLGVSSVVLCISFIMSVFAPFPLALSVVLYGRLKAFLVGLLGLVLSFGFAAFIYQDLTLFGFYACVLIIGFSIGEILVRGFNPVKGVVAVGLSLIALVGSLLFFTVKNQGVNLEQFIVKQLEMSSEKIAEQKALVEKSSDKESIQILQLLENPSLLAKEIKEALPSYLFIGVFLMLWFNTFLALKSRRLLLSGVDFPYSEKFLLSFKVPFTVVFILVIGLILATWGSDFKIDHLEVYGFTIIKCLGVFYFFQGFGVFSDLLNFLGIFGFFRTLLTMVVVFMANYLIAVAGLLDTWFDFRKYFVKQKLED